MNSKIILGIMMMVVGGGLMAWSFFVPNVVPSWQQPPSKVITINGSQYIQVYEMPDSNWEALFAVSIGGLLLLFGSLVFQLGIISGEQKSTEVK